MNLKKTLADVRGIAVEAGAAIMEVYRRDEKLSTETKADDSPLTEADLAANRIVVARLQELTPGIPILAEESDLPDWTQRKHWSECWVVDPLDGTREFLKQNDEFTVNIALVRDHKPVLGVVYAPALQRWYYAARHEGAWRQDGKKTPIKLTAHPPEPGRPLKVVGSRSHNTPEFDEFVGRLGETETVVMGSSLKLCLVADGTADLYPRLGPTSEWDTCAAQAVVEQAGAQVLNFETGEPLSYNARESIINPHFIVCTESDPGWFK
ncbi:3'(2'),5'-bisphosphate nucleotidase CysQ [Wenzhouxiangella sp. AB-CW3]|uniref:3'(2'),5'-bisphosphate nucleotidase CysQ n=1 Tax=Wenzhouxiangella sp. AB-CW3 TaxID=2771012 RepID=UPI00168C0FC4|nr:3'(2'),5'-bisphosphate nucleotidase CysQ [Wenzhouxiangella sp. AB-CW3]QOC23083.1 3'(2'),5'-bisphosphate nucleotidase CysQ [Wenzhouxiangella sp. AB-CW3]